RPIGRPSCLHLSICCPAGGAGTSGLAAGVRSAVVADERIGPALLAEGRTGAVTADEADVVAEREQLFADRPNEGVVVAAGQVGAADRTTEQDVADECEAGRFVEQDDVAGGVPRTVIDGEDELSDG